MPNAGVGGSFLVVDVMSQSGNSCRTITESSQIPVLRRRKARNYPDVTAVYAPGQTALLFLLFLGDWNSSAVSVARNGEFSQFWGF